MAHLSTIQSVPLESARWKQLLHAVAAATEDGIANEAASQAAHYLGNLLEAGLVGAFQANRMAHDLQQAYACCMTQSSTQASSPARHSHAGAEHPFIPEPFWHR